MIKQEAKLSLG